MRDVFQFAVCTDDQLDKNDYCPNWAAKGYCSGIYEQFMQTTCYASCGNCEGKKIHNERMKGKRFNSHTGLNPKVIRLI